MVILPACLCRAMQFIVALLSRLQQDHSVTLHAAVVETYGATLQQYHGWIVSSTFTVAFNFVPSRSAGCGWVGCRWSR